MNRPNYFRIDYLDLLNDLMDFLKYRVTTNYSPTAVLSTLEIALSEIGSFYYALNVEYVMSTLTGDESFNESDVTEDDKLFFNYFKDNLYIPITKSITRHLVNVGLHSSTIFEEPRVTMDGYIYVGPYHISDNVYLNGSFHFNSRVIQR